MTVPLGRYSGASRKLHWRTASSPGLDCARGCTRTRVGGRGGGGGRARGRGAVSPVGAVASGAAPAFWAMAGRQGPKPASASITAPATAARFIAHIRNTTSLPDRRLAHRGPEG